MTSPAGAGHHASPADAAERRGPTRFREHALVTVGVVSVVVGVAGVFIPLLSTTPFVLLAGACFARSSPGLHARLRAHLVAGPILRDWEEHRTVSRRVKRIAVGMILGTTTASTVLLVATRWVGSPWAPAR